MHTIWFEILFVFVVLSHDRRRLVHFNVTAHPTAEWTAQQMVEAFPFDGAPKFVLRDRDRIYGEEFRKRLEVMGIKEVLSAPRSPWQRAYVERVIGSIRRECLGHVIIFDEASLRRTLHSYFSSYHRSRLHLSLDRDSPDPAGPFWRQGHRVSGSRWPSSPVRTYRCLIPFAAVRYFLRCGVLESRIQNPTGRPHSLNSGDR